MTTFGVAFESRNEPDLCKSSLVDSLEEGRHVQARQGAISAAPPEAMLELPLPCRLDLQEGLVLVA